MSIAHTQHSCEDENCNVCRGGLSLCTICGGAEESMPTECSGRDMTGDEQDEVYAGKLDFINDKWISK